MLTSDEQAQLLALAWHWEGTYTFRVTDGVWTATSASDPTRVLTGDSVSDLKELVRLDYAAGQAAARGPVHLSERMST
jgi:hypothetical protein